MSTARASLTHASLDTRRLPAARGLAQQPATSGRPGRHAGLAAAPLATGAGRTPESGAWVSGERGSARGSGAARAAGPAGPAQAPDSPLAAVPFDAPTSAGVPAQPPGAPLTSLT